MKKTKALSVIALLLAFALLALAFDGELAHAATITVNTTADELNGDGDCSLREAIQAANTNAAVDACPAGEAGPIVDTITFSVTGTITLTSGQLTVSDDLTIDGPGAANLTVSGNNASRVLQVSAGVTLDLNELTVANGSAFDGSGIFNSGTLSVTNSTLSRNSGGAFGGGIENLGTATVTNSTFSQNSASSGGGIVNFGAATVTESTFSGNSASFLGGGIYNFGVTMTIANSTFSENSASVLGGGIFNDRSALTVISSTLSGNSAGNGGGVHNEGELTARNTIVANSPSGGNCSGFPFFDGGGNLQHPGTDCGATIPSADPLLGPLSDNGGPTFTHALLTGSPAIDAGGPPCPPPATDQRGVSRPQGPACDIGAFELEVGPTCPVDDNDFDNDGTTNKRDKDDDNDGVRDGADSDDDNDSMRDSNDPDDDNDGIPDNKDKDDGQPFCPDDDD